MKQIGVKQQILFDNFGNFGYFALKVSKNVTTSPIGNRYLLVDKYKNSIAVELITIVPLTDVIPTVLAYHSLGVDSAAAFDIIQGRTKCERIDELAYYLYKKV